MDSSTFEQPSVARRASAVTLDAAVLLSFAPIVRRYQTNSSIARRLAVPVAIQAAYFTMTTALAGGTPGQRLTGLRVVDNGTGRRPSWRQSAVRWVVWAGPGIVARIVNYASRGASGNTEARPSRSREARTRLGEELADDPGHSDERLLALPGSRRMAVLWVPQIVTLLLLVIYKITVGRGAHDRLSGTSVVAYRKSS